MTNRLVIAGAGGFGRELLSWVRSSPLWREKNGIVDIAFIDDGEPMVAVDAPLISTLRNYQPEPGDVLLCAIGNPLTRRAVVEELEARGATFATFIDDRAVLGENITMGAGSVVCPGSIVTSNIVIGHHVHINLNCTVGHDVQIHDFVTLSPGCNINGNVVIEHNVFLGTAALVIPSRRVESGAIVGAGTVVVKDVPRGATVVGNPGVVRKIATL